MCGEYGEDTWRPHYHAIIFGYDFTEGIKYNKQWFERRQTISFTETEQPYYISKFLTALWGKSKNDSIIANVTWETAAYVARYCTKKYSSKGGYDKYGNYIDTTEEHYTRKILDWNEHTGEIYNFQETNLEPEYGTMSSGRRDHPNPAFRGGIGYAWYQDFKDDCYPSNYLIQDGHKTPIPKYYDKLLEVENEVMFSEIKLNRELALAAHKADLTPSRLKQRHITKLAQANQLTRNKI
jgi:hypothetical protein